MKVLLVSTLYPPNVMGGAEVFLETLAESLVESGTETVVLSLSEESQLKIEYRNGVKVYYAPLSNIFWPFRNEVDRSRKFLKPFWHALDIYNIFNKSAIEEVISDEKPDVVHTHNLMGWSTIVWQVSQRFGCPIVHTLHDYSLLCPKTTMFKDGQNCDSQCLSCGLYSTPKRSRSRLVNAVVSISQFMAKRHRDMNFFDPKHESFIIPNPIDLHAGIRPKELAGENLRFGYIGKISPHKGVEVLLSAMSSIERDDWSLKVAGSGDRSYVEDLKSKFADEKINFLGFVDANQFFTEIDVLIVPSLWNEPFGRVIIEAYSHGVPVIVARVGGATELVVEGQSGYLYDSTAEQLAQNVQLCLEHPENIPSMSEFCLQNSTSYDTQTVRDRYIDIYQSVLPSS